MPEKTGYITGIGGVFVKSKDTRALVKWYREKLKVPYDGNGASFLVREADEPEKIGYSVWGPFKEDSRYFEPSKRDFMINFRVKGLTELLARLKADGVEQIGEVEEFEYGDFAWILDPDGTKIELWEQKGPAPSTEVLE